MMVPMNAKYKTFSWSNHSWAQHNRQFSMMRNKSKSKDKSSNRSFSSFAFITHRWKSSPADHLDDKTYLSPLLHCILLTQKLCNNFSPNLKTWCPNIWKISCSFWSHLVKLVEIHILLIRYLIFCFDNSVPQLSVNSAETFLVLKKNW